MHREQLLRVVAEDMPKYGRCRYCDQQLRWCTTAKGKNIPINAGARPLHSDTNADTKVRYDLYDRGDVHFVTCKNSPGKGKR